MILVRLLRKVRTEILIFWNRRLNFPRSWPWAHSFPKAPLTGPLLVRTKALFVACGGYSQPPTLNALWSSLAISGSYFWSTGSALKLFLVSKVKALVLFFRDLCQRVFSEGFVYLRGLFLIFFADALIADDEPIWEPLEWSLLQSWILFIFLFAWIAENLVVSRYGSYTGRDKRIWFSWYKTFWLLKFWYLFTMVIAILFVMVPYYYEINYFMSLTASWWNWYSRVFFFQFLSYYLVTLFLAYLLHLNLRHFQWKKVLFLVVMISFSFSYLLYIHFFMAFFSYFTNTNWYNHTRVSDYVQLSHEPGKWGWGNKKRDHFSYHKSSTVFWFKNDGPMAASFIFLHFLFLLSLVITSIYWAVLVRRIYCTSEFTHTYTTYAVSSLRQFFYFFLLFYLFIAFSFVLAYWRFPIEFLWLPQATSPSTALMQTCVDYPYFLFKLFF